MKKGTKYYVFEDLERQDKLNFSSSPVCSCRTLFKAKRVLATLKNGYIEKSSYTKSSFRLRMWIPRCRRVSPKCTIKKLYLKSLREGWR